MSLASGVKLRRGFENTGLKANRFNSAQFSEPILTQGEINADCIVDARLGKLREQAVKDLPRDEVFGSDLGQNMQFVDIGMQEPLLIHRKPITSNGFEKYFPKKAHVFSSLNGMYIIGKKRGLTQLEFERQFDFFGFAQSGVTFGIGKESSMKVAARLAGSGTTENTGNDEIHIGDEVQWTLNSIDDLTRQKELENAPEVQYKSKYKMGVVWRRADYSDATYYLHDALADTFREQNETQVRDFTILLDHDRSQHLNPRLRLGMLMRLLVAFAAYNGIVQALERGWVEPRAPVDFSSQQASWSSNFNSESWAAIDEIHPLDLSRGAVLTRQNQPNELVFEPNPDPALKRFNARWKQFMAAKHGFAGEQFGSGKSFLGSQAYLDTITARTLRGMITTDDKVFAGGDLSLLFEGAEEDTPVTVASDGLNRVLNLESLTGIIMDIQSRVGNDLYATAITARNEHASKIVLKSLSHAVAGEKFNYLLKIH